MKHLLASACILLTAAITASAQGYHYRNGYVTRTGTYVPGHYQTNPNGSRFDNWSTSGNYNPFTGKPGYKNPYSGSSSSGTGSSGYRYRFGR